MADLSSLTLSDGFGLNKARRLAEAGSEDEPALQPPWPYEVLGFDDRYFGAIPSDEVDS
jgi:hypothetical protein